MAEHPRNTTDRHWHTGDTAVLRYITTRDALVGATWPCRVVTDRDDLLALYIATAPLLRRMGAMDTRPGLDSPATPSGLGHRTGVTLGRPALGIPICRA
ncbi:MAG: hypothetical protein AB7R89_03005 [Dehalococcoidia bacterium]